MEMPTTQTIRATRPRTRKLAREARAKIAAWITKRVRTFARNTTDPITLDPLLTPVFKHVHPRTGFVYGFHPETLAAYFTTSRNFTHPLTREPFNVVEVRRLTKLLPLERGALVMSLFGQTLDVQTTATDTAAAAADADADAAINVYPVSFVFNILSPVPSVFSIVACMLDVARLDHLHGEIFRGNINDVVSIYVFILLPMLHNQFQRDDDTTNHCLYLIQQAICLVNMIKASEEGAVEPIYNHELLGIISHILAQFFATPN